jgi:hypothetical protein
VKRAVFLIALGLSMLSGCASGPTAPMTRLDNFTGGEEQLHRLYEEHHAPLVIVGHGIYLPPPQVLGKSPEHQASPAPPASPVAEAPAEAAEPSAKDQDEGRHYGGLAEQRIVGGFAEQRVFGGGTLPIKCTRQGDRLQIIIPLGGEVQYFDGHSLHAAPDGLVPLR